MTNQHDDLPLFNWRPPACQIIAFPMRRNIGKARRTAEVLAGMKPKVAEAHWRRTTDRLARQLQQAGLDEQVVERELADFAIAVDKRLGRDRV